MGSVRLREVTQMQGALVVAASCLILYAYFLTLLLTVRGTAGFPRLVRFIATLIPATAPLSLAGRLTGGFACVVSLGVLLFAVTVRRNEFDSTGIAILYLAITLAVLWTAYLLRALLRRRDVRRRSRAPGETT
jgi:hypothetical protein